MVIQQFIDSDAGQVIGTILHTVGAIALLGALIGYIAWARGLPTNRVSLLQTSSFAAYVAIATNLAGGFMRTYTTGHPGLSQLATSSWVQIMFVKHLFIFAGMAAAIFLFEKVAPRLLASREERSDTDKLGFDHNLGVWIVALSILISSVLGAMTQVTNLSMGQMDEPMPEPEFAVQYLNASGQLTSLPGVPAASAGSFQLPAGTSRIEAVLVWAPEQFALGFGLTALNGSGNTGQANPAVAGGRQEMTLESTPEAPLATGEWQYRVNAEVAQATWSMTLRFTINATGMQYLEETYVVPSGTFFEINTVMEEGQNMHWDWTSNADLAFNLHTHVNGETEYVVEETTDAHAGHWEAQVSDYHSLMWENTGPVPITLTYRVWGEFTLDSYFPPRN